MSQSNRSTAIASSMTGFGGAEGEVSGKRMRLEIKALNHRFLDLKIRLPRELSSCELPLRALLQSKLTRGSIELKLEKLAEAASGDTPSLMPNLTLAAQYYECMITLQKALGLKDEVPTSVIATFPGVIISGEDEASLISLSTPEELWKSFKPLAAEAIGNLLQMRHHEGRALTDALLDTIHELEETTQRLRDRRATCLAQYQRKISDKVKAISEAYPLSVESVKPWMETRIAQELAILIDRTDIEEELIRFQGHLDHFRKTLSEGGSVGRKLDFILQELGREVNTLGNKAQDFSMSEDVVQVKVRLEQIREQVMNLE